MVEQVYYLTPEAANKIKMDLAELKGPKREALAERLRHAISMGDLSENADYIAAKEEQAFLEGKILEYETLLKNATIVDKKPSNGEVGIGSKVLVSVNGDEPELFYIVGMKEADPKSRKISNESPIGNALMGQKPGAKVKAYTPGGELQIEVLEIS